MAWNTRIPVIPERSGIIFFVGDDVTISIYRDADRLMALRVDAPGEKPIMDTEASAPRPLKSPWKRRIPSMLPKNARIAFAIGDDVRISIFGNRSRHLTIGIDAPRSTQIVADVTPRPMNI